jgi:hypothetical protein
MKKSESIATAVENLKKRKEKVKGKPIKMGLRCRAMKRENNGREEKNNVKGEQKRDKTNTLFEAVTEIQRRLSHAL